MPLIRLDVIEGRSAAEITTLLDAVHDAVVKAFEVPDRDRYQVVSSHPAQEMVVHDTGLGIERTRDVVLIQVTSRPRTTVQKEVFYRTVVELLDTNCGISANDVMVCITENSDADWSFGNGEAHFLTGAL
ncbi:tautomerase family protein [Rhodococcus tibetensis]|uniref:Tautomerase family protein n=1 Tax=Rhodococcus tibetensis TaxID=2965064 RepID=A0ABT1Q916_9NOCA|nr:tautomerase family protein [Rhodococcus sp. FXJ9.536]MCQ4118746.1 tautomerase family protein [Rhodococcus sp. FXJ9.536]